MSESRGDEAEVSSEIIAAVSACANQANTLGALPDFVVHDGVEYRLGRDGYAPAREGTS